MQDKKIRKIKDLLVVFPSLPQKNILTKLNVLPSMWLSKYGHTLHFREGNICFYSSLRSQICLQESAGRVLVPVTNSPVPGRLARKSVAVL